MAHGRQHIPGIIRYTGLTALQVKHGLAVLIQQHLAVWSSGEPAFYEGYWPAAYALLRSGKITKAARDRLGESAKLVLTQCLLDGDANANELERIPEPTLSSLTNGIDGSSNETNGNREVNESQIYDLLENGFIVLSNASYFRTKTENLNAAEQHVKIVRPEWSIKIKPVERPAFKLSVKKTLLDWKYGSGDVKKAIQERSLDGTFNLKRAFRQIEGTQDEDDYKPSKKLKISNHTHDGSGVKGSFDLDVTIRPNYEKYAVLARSQRLVRLAADKIGVPTSKVYATVLHLLDKDIMQCNEFERDEETAMMDDRREQKCIKIGPILESLGSSEDLLTGIGTPYSPGRGKSPPPRTYPKKRRRLSDDEGTDSDSDINPRVRLKPNGKAKVQEPSVPVVNGKGKGKEKEKLRYRSTTPIMNGKDKEKAQESNPPVRNGKGKGKGQEASTPITNGKGKGKAEIRIEYEESDTATISDDADVGDTSSAKAVALRKHLAILVDHNLLHHHAPSGEIDGKESWSVPFAILSHTLRLTEINTTMTAHYGSPALRILHILQKHGKLDEKTLIAYSLLATKLLRSTLSSLHSAGYIELQEVPRDNNRAPSKTLYLWFFDEGRCSRRLLDDYYQAMSRCLQRLKAERDGVRELLAKSQRSDVRGREKEFLLGEEWKKFEKWREVEETLLGEVSRLDEGVVVLRDL